MQAKYSIITTCKGRLDHLRETLPRMLEQPEAEVVVVDWSCPQDTAAVVARDFPKARVVKVEGEQYFSNWRARNAGAAAATGDILVFCDADTLLAPNMTRALGAVIGPRTYGFFARDETARFNTTKLRLGFNQLRGFLALPAAVFRRIGGYDEVLEGYAAGADTELEVRLGLFGIRRVKLDPALVERVVEHGNEDRLRNHAIPIKLSYGAGYLYRKAKTVLMQVRRKPVLPLPVRERLYATARKAAQSLGNDRDVAAITLDLDSEMIGMPLQLGYRKVKFGMKLTLSLTGSEPVDDIPLMADERDARHIDS